VKFSGMGNKTITFDLNKPLMDEEGKPIKQLEKIQELEEYVSLTKTQFQEKLNEMTDVQLRKKAPHKTFGILVREILAKHIDTSKDNELAVQVFEMIQRINAKINNQGGKWEMDSTDLKKLTDILKKNTGNLKGIQYGQLLSHLKELEATLTLAEKETTQSEKPPKN
jgi:predicted DNA-binding protein